MNSFDAFGHDFALRLTLTLVHFVWQGVGVAVAVAVAGWCLRRSAANLRYGVNVAALMLMAVCFPVTFAVVSTPSGNRTPEVAEVPDTVVAGVSAAASGQPTGRRSSLPAEGGASASASAEDGHAAPSAAQPSTVASPDAGGHDFLSLLQFAAPFATGVYLLGLVIMLLRLAAALWGGRNLRLASTPVTDANLLAMLGRQARRLGIKTAPAIACCARISVPVVVGIVTPLVLLPASLATGLTASQLESLLAHELAHIRRYDLVVNLLQRLIEVVLFFHPAVWYISRGVSREREEACDDLVLSAGWPRVQYADALVRMAELCSQGLPAISGGQDDAATLVAASGSGPSHFQRRILRLLQPDIAPGLRLTTGSLVLMAVLVAGALLSPSLIQSWASSVSPNDDPSVQPAASATSPPRATEVVASESVVKPGAGTPLKADSAGVSVGQIAAAWKARQERFRTAKFEWTETKRIPRGATLPEAHLGVLRHERATPADERVDPHFRAREDILLEGAASVSFDGVKVRYRRDYVAWRPEVGRFVRSTNLEAFDGVVNKALFLNEIPDNGQSSRVPARAEFVHGREEREMYNWYNKRPILPIWYLCRPLDPAFLKLDLGGFRVSAKTEEINGQACAVLEPTNPGERAYSFCVDPTRDFVVVRARSLYNRGKTVDWSVEISYLRDPVHGRIPSGWVRTDYLGGTDVIVATTTATVKKYEVNTAFPPGEFQYSSAAVATDGGQQPGTELGWGEPAAGIRCRLLPAAQGTSEDNLAAASTFDRFDQCEDMTFAVELKNVSGQTVRLLGPYYNVQGKRQLDRFGPFLFTFEFQPADGRSVDRPDQKFLPEDVARMLSQMEVATLDPGQSLRMLLRPGTWRYGQACQLASGTYRAIVRYRGPMGDVGERLKRLNVPAKDAWAAEVASAPVTFTLTGVPPRKQPDLVWGPVTQGLQAAVEFVPQQESYVVGAKADVRFHVRNVSDQAIRFSTEQVRQGDRVTVINEAGQTQRVTNLWHSGRAVFIHFTLKPAQEAVLDAVSLGIVETDEQVRQSKLPVGNRLVCAPGRYTVRYAIRFGNVVRKDATGKQTVPVEGDWVGTIETGPVSLVVRRQAGSGLPGLGVNGEEAKTVMKESDTLTPEQVVQQQPKGKVTVKFRVASVGLQGWSDQQLNEFLQGTMPGGGFAHGSDPPIRLESPVKLPNGGKFYVLLVGHVMSQATKDVQHLAAKEDHESLCVYRLIKPLQKHFTGKTVRATGELEHTKVPRAVREDGTVEGPMSDEYVLRIDSPDGFQVVP
jgi:beta-lactamase regulating signal transducer with metallopeptidase domain